MGEEVFGDKFMNNKSKVDILNSLLNDYFIRSSSTIGSVMNDLSVVKKMALGIYESLNSGGKLLIAGNGGSCTDSEHFAGEVTCTFRDRNRKAFPAISLTNNAAITAWGNDFGFDSYFDRQVDALGCPGDVLFLISTSGGDLVNGGSMNLVKAAANALKKDMKLYALVGKSGGELSKISHEFITVSSFETSHIQEAHIAIIHAICLIIDYLSSGKTDYEIR